MARSYYVVQTNAVAGREAEFDEWYSNRHLSDVLAVPGFVAAQRFELSPTQRPGLPAPRYRYLALYEIEGDPADALEALGRAVADGMELSDAMAPDRSAYVFRPTTGRLTAS